MKDKDFPVSKWKENKTLYLLKFKELLFLLNDMKKMERASQDVIVECFVSIVASLLLSKKEIHKV